MGAVVASALIVAVQLLTGAAWWAMVRRRGRMSAAELGGMGLALGTLVSGVCGVLLADTGVASWAWLIPTIVSAPFIALLIIRRGFASLDITWPAREWIAIAVGVASGVALLLVNWSRVPLDALNTRSYADLFFFEALSRGLAETGTWPSIFMSSGSLRYHWFTYGWAGEVAQTSGSASFTSLLHTLPVVSLVGVTLLGAAWTARLTTNRWAPTMAVLLLVVAGYTGALYGAILNFDSPSQSLTTVWLLAFAGVFTGYVRGRTSSAALVPLAVLAAGTCGGKVSHAVVAAGGAGLVLVVGLVRREPWSRRALTATVVAGLAIGSTYVLVLSGVAVDRNLTEAVAVKASTWQGLDPVAGTFGVVLGTSALILGILARVAGLGWLLRQPRSRTSPDTLFATGGLLVGIGALLVLSEGVNELWFVLAASAPAAVLSAHGMSAGLTEAGRLSARFRRPLLWAVAVAVPASAASLLLSMNWGSHQRTLNFLAPVAAWVLTIGAAAALVLVLGRAPRRGDQVLAFVVAGLTLTSILTRPASAWTASRPVTTETGAVQPAGASTAGTAGSPAALTPEEEFALVQEAARWLVEHGRPDDVVATASPVSAAVPAYTGAQMFVAGVPYQLGLGSADQVPMVLSREAVSVSFAASGDDASGAALCDASVDWMWVDGRPTTAWPDGVEAAFANDGVTVLRFTQEYCGED